MPQSERINKARSQLELAESQLDEACSASWDPTDPADCVSKTFYALENAVVAAAIALDMPWQKNHMAKADLAKELFEKGKVSMNIRDRLIDLNALRKDISYSVPGPMLANVDLEKLVTELEEYLTQVESLLHSVEEAG
ncbi:MAG: hypothetical protein OXI92_18755 [Acidobacteriota bacterium]|nr:hypothetical protein [Acidobacteriota bacterium]